MHVSGIEWEDPSNVKPYDLPIPTLRSVLHTPLSRHRKFQLPRHNFNPLRTAASDTTTLQAQSQGLKFEFSSPNLQLNNRMLSPVTSQHPVLSPIKKPKILKILSMQLPL